MRHFTPWQRPREVEDYYLEQIVGKITGQYKVPFGDALISTRDTCLGLETCEELFTPNGYDLYSPSVKGRRLICAQPSHPVWPCWYVCQFHLTALCLTYRRCRNLLQLFRKSPRIEEARYPYQPYHTGHKIGKAAKHARGVNSNSYLEWWHLSLCKPTRLRR